MAFFFGDDVEVLDFTVHCVLNDKCFWILPYRAQLSLPQSKTIAEDYESDDDDDVDDDDDANSEGGFDGTLDKLSDLSESDKDCVRCALR